VRGAADDSYGIEVAKLAGVPSEVTKRAQVILDSLIDGKDVPQSKLLKKAQTADFAPVAISFDDLAKNEIADKLRAIDINTITPIEAMTKLYELKKLL
jgi:DNA mismatch repair protein MutS